MLNYLKPKAYLMLFFIMPYNIMAQDGNFKKIGDYSFPLDINTGFYADCMQVFENQGVRYLALGYRNARKINIYNFLNRKIVKRITFDLEGPNGIGTEMAAFHIEDFNSIYIYSYWGRTIFHSDSTSRVKNKFVVPSNPIYPIIEPGTLCPMVKAGNYFFLSGVMGSPGDIQRHSPILRVNINDHQIDLLGDVPFKAKKWNYYRKNNAKFDYLPRKKFFVISFDMSEVLPIGWTELSES